jgi:hypothetical protein
MALPPCAGSAFMSNIKVFPMAMLPGWSFAPTKLQAPRSFEHCSQIECSQIAFSNRVFEQHPADVGFGLPFSGVQ